jgi:hypothetical protein
MRVNKNYKVEWSRLAHHHVIVVTDERGARVVHSSKNPQYLQRLVDERYSGAVS